MSLLPPCLVERNKVGAVVKVTRLRPVRSYDELMAGQAARVAAKQAEHAEIMSRAVDRDPCPRCNVRRDVGCAHTAERLVAR